MNIPGHNTTLMFYIKLFLNVYVRHRDSYREVLALVWPGNQGPPAAEEHFCKLEFGQTNTSHVAGRYGIGVSNGSYDHLIS